MTHPHCRKRPTMLLREKSHPGQRRASVRKKAVRRANQQAIAAEAEAAGMSVGQLLQKRFAVAATIRAAGPDLSPYNSGDYIPQRDGSILSSFGLSRW